MTAAAHRSAPRKHRDVTAACWDFPRFAAALFSTGAAVNTSGFGSTFKNLEWEEKNINIWWRRRKRGSVKASFVAGAALLIYKGHANANAGCVTCHRRLAGRTCWVAVLDLLESFLLSSGLLLEEEERRHISASTSAGDIIRTPRHSVNGHPHTPQNQSHTTLKAKSESYFPRWYCEKSWLI